jgi:hypothetical protein
MPQTYTADVLTGGQLSPNKWEASRINEIACELDRAEVSPEVATLLRELLEEVASLTGWSK